MLLLGLLFTEFSAHSSVFLQSILIGVAGGLSVGIGNFLAESVAVSICSWLEHCGVISRYIPDTKPFAEHPPSNIFAVGLPYIPLYYAISCAWPTFASRAVMNYSPLNIWPFIVTAMLVHDAWFFAFHTVFHKFRRLYKHIHSMHHRLGASCSPFGNAYADALDIGLCFVSFHAALFLFLYNQPRWNPPAVIALIVVEVTTNIVGHCGYRLPYWLHILVTGGVGILPTAANSKTHYIHHLQPQYNRALYFIHWDFVTGTYRDSIKAVK